MSQERYIKISPCWHSRHGETLFPHARPCLLCQHREIWMYLSWLIGNFKFLHSRLRRSWRNFQSSFLKMIASGHLSDCFFRLVFSSRVMALSCSRSGSTPATINYLLNSSKHEINQKISKKKLCAYGNLVALKKTGVLWGLSWVKLLSPQLISRCLHERVIGSLEWVNNGFISALCRGGKD